MCERVSVYSEKGPVIGQYGRSHHTTALQGHGFLATQGPLCTRSGPLELRASSRIQNTAIAYFLSFRLLLVKSRFRLTTAVHILTLNVFYD
jgi:hypothetical protein